jgi:hypothetical protein
MTCFPIDTSFLLLCLVSLCLPGLLIYVLFELTIKCLRPVLKDNKSANRGAICGQESQESEPQGAGRPNIRIKERDFPAPDMCAHVFCPGCHRGACSWKGSLTDIIKHVVAEKCVQIVKARRRCDGKEAIVIHRLGETVEEAWCSSVIGDFGEDQPGLSALGRPVVTHWKPVFLIDGDSVRLFPYMVLYRSPRHGWLFTVHSYADQDVRNKYEVTVKVTAPSARMSPQASVESFVGWAFQGGVLAPLDDEHQVLESGHFLALSDHQVKKVRENRVLLHYYVRIVPKKDMAE